MIGDCWFYIENDLAHCFFLAASDIYPASERHFHWDIGHAVSRDLKNWDYAGIALKKGNNGAWDSKNLATGSIVKIDDKYLMAYTGHKKDECPEVQRTGLAISDDLFKWEKFDCNPVSEPDIKFYEFEGSGQRKFVHWRDPFLYVDKDTVYQFVCARKQPIGNHPGGIIGAARSSLSDLCRWEALPPVEVDPVTEELECPSIHFISGKYYLLFCTHPFLMSNEFKEKHGDYNFISTTYCMVSDKLLGPYRMHGTGEIITSEPRHFLYAAQLVDWKGELFILGTDALNNISDPVLIRTVEHDGLFA